jgi:outer membrane protein assembly factor BamB
MPRIQAIAILLPMLLAADWPQFRGPNRDGVSKEKGLLQSWPTDGPPLVWTAKGLGGGYSSVSVAGDRIYTLGDKGNRSHLVALSREDGTVVWSVPIGATGGSLGCTPTVDGDLIFALGQQGDLICVDKTGKEIWKHNLLSEFGGEKGGWNYCESPLVDGDNLIVTPGGRDATMLALNKKTGETVWKCPIKTRKSEAGYSSVVVSKVGNVKHYVQLFNGGLVGVSTDGKVLWTHEKLGDNTANVPTPIVIGDQIFSSIGYGRGASLMKLKSSGKSISALEVYYKRELTNKHGGVVLVGDYVYGDTDDSGQPFCAELKTGKVMWKRSKEGKGNGSVAIAAADNRLYLHYQNGVVVLAEASPKAYKEVGSYELPKKNGQLWAHPAISGGRYYVRNGDLLHCFDISAKK